MVLCRGEAYMLFCSTERRVYLLKDCTVADQLEVGSWVVDGGAVVTLFLMKGIILQSRCQLLCRVRY